MILELWIKVRERLPRWVRSLLISLTPPSLSRIWETYLTPAEVSLDPGEYQITMPRLVSRKNGLFKFREWENGSTDPVRIITVNERTSMMSITSFEDLIAAIEQEKEGSYMAFYDEVNEVTGNE